MSAALFDAEMATFIEGLAGSPARLDSDRLEHERIPQGATRYQLRVDVIGEDPSDSNGNRVFAQMVVNLKHRLGAGQTERSYTTVTMLSQQAALVGRATYRAFTNVYGIVDDGPPEINEEATRVGDVISYEMQAQLLLT